MAGGRPGSPTGGLGGWGRPAAATSPNQHKVWFYLSLSDILAKNMILARAVRYPRGFGQKSSQQADSANVFHLAGDSTYETVCFFCSELGVPFWGSWFRGMKSYDLAWSCLKNSGEKIVVEDCRNWFSDKKPANSIYLYKHGKRIIMCFFYEVGPC